MPISHAMQNEPNAHVTQRKARPIIPFRVQLTTSYASAQQRSISAY